MSGWRDSNPRSSGPKPDALANWATPRLYSLNYGGRDPFSFFVPRVRIELTTQGFSVLCSTTELPRLLLRGSDLNRRPPGYGPGELPTALPRDKFHFENDVGNGGLEPPTSTLSVLRSNQLS